jgi:hypothetical protein
MNSGTWRHPVGRDPLGRLAWLVALAALLTSGCKEDQVTKPVSPADSEFTLRVGEHRQLEPRRTRLGFERVVADSRCPIHVVCVWAGEATVRLWLVESRDTAFVELRMPGPFAAAETLGLRIDPIKLEPVPEVPGPIDPSSYRLTLRVTPLPD